MKPSLRLIKTEAARLVLSGPRDVLTPTQRMLLLCVNGEQSVHELRQLTRSLGLDESVLREFRRQGLVDVWRERRSTEAHPSGFGDSQVDATLATGAGAQPARRWSLDLVL